MTATQTPLRRELCSTRRKDKHWGRQKLARDQ